MADDSALQSNSASVVLESLGRLKFEGSRIKDLITSSQAAKRITSLKTKDPATKNAKAYARAWIAMNDVKQIPVIPSPPTTSPDEALTSLLTSPGKGQLVPVIDVVVPDLKVPEPKGFTRLPSAPPQSSKSWCSALLACSLSSVSSQLLGWLSHVAWYLDKMLAGICVVVFMTVLFNPGLLITLIFWIFRSVPWYFGFAAQSVRAQLYDGLGFESKLPGWNVMQSGYPLPPSAPSHTSAWQAQSPNQCFCENSNASNVTIIYAGLSQDKYDYKSNNECDITHLYVIPTMSACIGGLLGLLRGLKVRGA